MSSHRCRRRPGKVRHDACDSCPMVGHSSAQELIRAHGMLTAQSDAAAAAKAERRNSLHTMRPTGSGWSLPGRSNNAPKNVLQRAANNKSEGERVYIAHRSHSAGHVISARTLDSSIALSAARCLSSNGITGSAIGTTSEAVSSTDAVPVVAAFDQNVQQLRGFSDERVQMKAEDAFSCNVAPRRLSRTRLDEPFPAQTFSRRRSMGSVSSVIPTGVVESASIRLQETLPLKKTRNDTGESTSSPWKRRRSLPCRKDRARKQCNRLYGDQKGLFPKIFDDPDVVLGYASVPLLEVDRLPRGGLSLDTMAVGRIQFGIPPETIKDSMRLGMGVPSVFIVPVERFCREMGPSLGVNLAEFEFPCYFNYFVRGKQCTLVVDSEEAASSIKDVFGETLLGPAQFRNHDHPTFNEDEDFDPRYPTDARPNFYQEFNWFRKQEKTDKFEELCIDMLINFCQFEKHSQFDRHSHTSLGVPPHPPTAVVYSGNCEQSRATMFPTSIPLPISAQRRHTTWLEDTDHFSNDGSSIGSTSSHSNQSPKTPPSSSSCKGCGKCGANGTINASHGSLEDVAGLTIGLRRVVSNPDLKMKSIDTNSMQNPFLFSFESSKKTPRRASVESALSESRPDCTSWASAISLMIDSDEDDDNHRTTWMYSQVKWLGEIAKVYPHTATPEQKATNSCPRVEIFKMTGGTEYVVHDIDQNNTIIGKARFSGTVRVPDEIAVAGFLTKDVCDSKLDAKDVVEEFDKLFNKTVGQLCVPGLIAPPSFHPPSFGVTVLGNSHGFDKHGSTSGYVLWINGRGVMIDPPPYSSATLEREGIRPRMIIAIMITHCHADHDAGAFQKVMTGSRVALITTPTIYKSFIRKYAALSGLSPVLLSQSHRHRAAIIGQPLKFQGATFHFFYTLHTIPCIAFSVEWRGRSMVFTGDHMNIPSKIDSLERQGVLSKARADDIRSLPLKDCDVLLHECGAPPIHTPLDVLLQLPEAVKNRLYVVHTAALPDDCELRVAPTGTAGTIRLDEICYKHSTTTSRSNLVYFHDSPLMPPSPQEESGRNSFTPTAIVLSPEVGRDGDGCSCQSVPNSSKPMAPLVLMRPTCVSDAWFILNLLSAVPFLSSLSYANTMEVLEIAQVEVFCFNEVVVPSHQRKEVLCLVWEGTCMESQNRSSRDIASQNKLAVWHAGDWTGPKSLQPQYSLSGDSNAKDVVAVSSQGVKVIMLNMKNLHRILKNGSSLYRKYLNNKRKEDEAESLRNSFSCSSINSSVFRNGWRRDSVQSLDTNGSRASLFDTSFNFLDIISNNSALGSLSPLQKRHLESLVEGPRLFEEGQFIWQLGTPVDFSYIIVSGTAKFAGTKTPVMKYNRRGSTGSILLQPIQRLHRSSFRISTDQMYRDKQITVSPNSEYARLEIGLQLRAEEIKTDSFDHTSELLAIEERRRKARDRFANKVLARLYARQAFTAGLIFSRGHFLSDTTRMVTGSLAFVQGQHKDSFDALLLGKVENMFHSSSIVAGAKGCVVMVFPRDSLVSFLDAHPGVLLSFLGTQIVV